MTFSRCVKLSRKLAALLFLFLIAGCLTSPNPFYNESDIIQDPRFVGTFMNKQQGSDLTAAIFNDDTIDKRYLVHVTEFRKTSDYRVTLFKIKDSVFADLIPVSEGKVSEQYQEGAPTASGLLQGVSHDGKVSSSTRLHMLFRLSLSDKGIECFCTRSMGDPSNPILKYSGLKYHANKSESIEPDDFVIDETTEKLRSIVERYAGTNWIQLFVSKSENSDEVLSLKRIQKDAIPAELVGEWAANQSKFKGGILSTGVAIYINTFGIAGIVEAPEPALPSYDIGNKLDATYNITNRVLTLTKEPDPDEDLTNSITNTFIYDPRTKTMSPKNAIIKDVLKRRKDHVPYGVIEDLE